LSGKLPCSKKRKDACCDGKRLIFLARKLAKQKRSVKNGQHQHKDRPQTQEKSQSTATSVEDAIIILWGLNLCGAHGTADTLYNDVRKYCNTSAGSYIHL
jgi:hypothetical protein